MNTGWLPGDGSVTKNLLFIRLNIFYTWEMNCIIIHNYWFKNIFLFYSFSCIVYNPYLHVGLKEKMEKLYFAFLPSHLWFLNFMPILKNGVNVLHFQFILGWNNIEYSSWLGVTSSVNSTEQELELWDFPKRLPLSLSRDIIFYGSNFLYPCSKISSKLLDGAFRASVKRPLF